MANATVSRIGQVNAAGDADALFLKVFSNEVLTSFEQATVTKGKYLEKTIGSGKSATFPVLGRSSSSIHTPGNEIVGSALNHNEKVITINDVIIAHHFIAEIDEAKNHYETRQIYSQEIGRALAFQVDKYVMQSMVQAAMATANVGDTGYKAGSVITDADADTSATSLIGSLFDAAEKLDDAYCPSEDRYAYMRPDQYYQLANASNAANADFRGSGSIASGTMPVIAGINIVKVPHLPTTNITGTGVDAGGSGGRQAVDASNTVALVTHKSAVGCVKLMDVSVASDYDPRRLGTLMVGKMAMGFGALRPEAAVQIQTA